MVSQFVFFLVKNSQKTYRFMSVQYGTCCFGKRVLNHNNNINTVINCSAVYKYRHTDRQYQYYSRLSAFQNAFDVNK